VRLDPVTTVKSPNRMDALVWAMTELSDGTGMGLLDFMKGQAAAVARPKMPTRDVTTITTQPGFG